MLPYAEIERLKAEVLAIFDEYATVAHTHANTQKYIRAGNEKMNELIDFGLDNFTGEFTEEIDRKASEIYADRLHRNTYVLSELPPPLVTMVVFRDLIFKCSYGGANWFFDMTILNLYRYANYYVPLAMRGERYQKDPAIIAGAFMPIPS